MEDFFKGILRIYINYIKYRQRPPSSIKTIIDAGGSFTLNLAISSCTENSSRNFPTPILKGYEPHSRGKTVLPAYAQNRQHCCGAYGKNIRGEEAFTGFPAGRERADP